MEIRTNTAGEGDNLSDASVGRAFRNGSLLGVPAIYAVMVVIVLAAGGSWAQAFLIATWPALVAGPFFGGLLLLGRLVLEDEHPVAVIPLPLADTTRSGQSARAA